MARDLAQGSQSASSSYWAGRRSGAGSAVAECLGYYGPVELAALVQERLEGRAVRGGQHTHPMITSTNSDLPTVTPGCGPGEQSEATLRGLGVARVPGPR